MIKYESYNPKIPSGFVVFENNVTVAGINYRMEEALAFVKARNLRLEFERDQSNSSDYNAIKIIGFSKAFWRTKRYFIGFLPRDISKYINQSKFYNKTQPILSSILVNDYKVENIFVRNIEIRFHIIGPADLYQTYQEAYSELTFSLDSINPSILAICEVGDIINLWMKPDKSGVVVFTNKNGLAGGAGKMGYVPRYLQGHIIENISKGGDYNSEIISINNGVCTIKSQKLTPEEVKKIHKEAMENYYQRIAGEIVKPYRPKTNFTLNFPLSDTLDKRKVKKGDIVYVVTNTKEYYLSHLDNLEIEIHDNKGILLGKANTTRTSIVRILRSVFSGYFLDAHIESVEKDDWICILITPKKK